MSSKTARRQRREQQRLRELADAPPSGDHVVCADADLAVLAALLDEATELLTELGATASAARDGWPIVPQTDELRGLFEAARNTAIDSRAKLMTLHDRVGRYRETGRHYHVAGGRVVRMVALADEASPSPSPYPDEDIPF